MEEIPIDAIAKIIRKVSVEEFIAIYEKSRS